MVETRSQKKKSDINIENAITKKRKQIKDISDSESDNDSDYDSDKLLLIVSNSDITHEFASSDYISDYSNTEQYLNIFYSEYI